MYENADLCSHRPPLCFKPTQTTQKELLVRWYLILIYFYAWQYAHWTSENGNKRKQRESSRGSSAKLKHCGPPPYMLQPVGLIGNRCSPFWRGLPSFIISKLGDWLLLFWITLCVWSCFFYSNFEEIGFGVFYGTLLVTIVFLTKNCIDRTYYLTYISSGRPLHDIYIYGGLNIVIII